MRVSHETIDLSLFVQSRGALRRELQRCLRSGQAMRSPRAKRLPQGRGQLRDTLHISLRPPEAADRAVPGHWEGDPVFGRRPSAVGTLVERHSRCVVFSLPDGATAERMRPALTAAVLGLPNGYAAPSPGTTAGNWPSTCSSPSTRACRSISAIRVAPGSVVPTRTPTACSATTPQEHRSAPVRPGHPRRDRGRAQRSPSTNPRLSDTLTGPGGGVALTP